MNISDYPKMIADHAFSKYKHEFVGKAETFATAAHAAVGQLRKYTNEPYIVHPLEVCDLVRNVTDNHKMLAAALLHDVVEDTKIELRDIQKHFGEEVATLVYYLTDISKPSDGNRTARKFIDLEHIAKAPPEAKTIKLADLISNTSTIVKHDPEFAKVYLHEKANLLQVLTEGDSYLYGLALKTLNDSLIKLDKGD